MKKRMFLLLAVPALLISCVSETDYQAETGTLSIPWGPKTGKNVPAEEMEPLDAYGGVDSSLAGSIK